jgi:peptidoglycan hydrolase-like protein with peptidoglycan-binding domain
MAQNETSSTSTTRTATKQSKRGPIFRATKEQINQAQALLKARGFYSGEQLGKLDDATREGLRKYQQAEGLKVTGTLNKVTLEKMNITLTDKQKSM